MFSYEQSLLITTEVNRNLNVDFNKCMLEHTLHMLFLHQHMNTLLAGFEKKCINYVKQ